MDLLNHKNVIERERAAVPLSWLIPPKRKKPQSTAAGSLELRAGAEWDRRRTASF